MSSVFKIITAAAAVLMATTAVAASKTMPLKPFTQLSAEDGFYIKVRCGDKPSMKMMTRHGDLSKVMVEVADGTLKIKRDGGGKEHGIKLVVTTASPLTTINVRNGVMLKLKSCAVDTKSFTANLENGVKARVNGQTDQLNLNLTKGVVFGDDDKDLKAKIANVNAKMGVKAYVCGAKTVTGNASMGSMVYTGDDAGTSGLSVSMGALKRDC